MRWISCVIIVFAASLLLAPQAHAIIFLPAIVLIPIAKIIAVIIGGFSFPAFGVGALWSRLFKKSFKRVIPVIILLLVVLGIILLIFFKIVNPDRPLY